MQLSTFQFPSDAKMSPSWSLSIKMIATRAQAPLTSAQTAGLTGTQEDSISTGVGTFDLEVQVLSGRKMGF